MLVYIRPRPSPQKKCWTSFEAVARMQVTRAFHHSELSFLIQRLMAMRCGSGAVLAGSCDPGK